MEADPHWSPRGDEFAYVSTALGERGDLWTKSAFRRMDAELLTQRQIRYGSSRRKEGEVCKFTGHPGDS